LFWWNSLKIRVWFGRKREGNREGGFGWKRGKGQGLMGKTPFFYLPSLPIQNRGGG
jgi:hypothetical protein